MNPYRSAISKPFRYTKSLHPRIVGGAGLISRLDRGGMAVYYGGAGDQRKELGSED